MELIIDMLPTSETISDKRVRNDLKLFINALSTGKKTDLSKENLYFVDRVEQAIQKAKSGKNITRYT